MPLAFAIETTVLQQKTLLASYICGSAVEDAAHFISTYAALSEARMAFLLQAPPSVAAQLPDPLTDSCKFTETMLGTCWVDDSDLQKFLYPLS